MGIDLDSDTVPIHAGARTGARELGEDALAWALTGVEDHHILAVFPRASAVPEDWTVVGVTTEAHAGVHVDGAEPVTQGWDHFHA